MLFATATFAEAAPTDFHCDELQRFRDNDLGVELRQLHRQLQLGQMALGFVDMSDPEQPRMATVEPPLREDLPYTNRYVASMAKMAILTTILTAVLVLRGETVLHQDYRRTETWLLMDKWHALPEARAHRMIVGIMQSVYRRFAVYASLLSVVLLGLTMLATALQPPGDPWVFTYRA